MLKALSDCSRLAAKPSLRPACGDVATSLQQMLVRIGTTQI
jgi:hypothetical protein